MKDPVSSVDNQHASPDYAAVARSMYESFNRRDFEQIMRNVDQGVEWLDVATGEIFRGPERLKKFLERWLAEYPDAHVEIAGLTCAGTRCAVQLTGRGRRLRPVMNRPGQFETCGTPFQLHFRHELEFANERLVRGQNHQEACPARCVFFHQAAEAAQLAPGTRLKAALAQTGSNFVVNVNSNAPNGPALAAAVFATADRDFITLQGFFGSPVFVWPLPFQVTIQAGSNGGSHKGCSSTAIECDAFDGTDSDLVRFCLVAEVSEVLEHNQNRGWDCSASNGEALSRVFAAELYPLELTTRQAHFETGPNWLGSSRPNWVDQTEGSDTNFVSIGCGTLFINWLRNQLGFSLGQVVQAGAQTLAGVYKNLTSDLADPFPVFKLLLDTAFPGTSTTMTGNLDNPFPLPSVAVLSTVRYLRNDAPGTNALRQLMLSKGVGNLRALLNSDRATSLV